MSYLIKDTTKEQRKEYVQKALCISMSDAPEPSSKALLLAKKYIDGLVELEEIQKLILKEYQK